MSRTTACRSDSSSQPSCRSPSTSQDLLHQAQITVADVLKRDPQEVQGAVADDRRGPTAEVVQVPGDVVQGASDLQPPLGGHVVGVVPADQHGGVPDQAWLEVAVERTETALVPVLRGVQRGR